MGTKSLKGYIIMVNSGEAAGAVMFGAGGATMLQAANEVVQLGAGVVAIAGGLILVYRFFRPFKDERISEIIRRLDDHKAELQAQADRMDDQDHRMEKHEHK